ncbi:MAG: stage III sporulation protein AB [Oscillospiraceae bacterium]|nr:stage III sporulation protein AB [Oscillospiraceae bacterium]
MTRLAGAALVILTGGWIGLSAAGELGRRVAVSRRLRGCVERMRTEICIRRISLPETLEIVRSLYPEMFTAPEEGRGIYYRSFSEVWDGYIRAMGLPAAEEETMRRLGGSLAGGDDPERAFAAATRELEEEHASLCAWQTEHARLYAALGFAGGSLAAILML